MTNRQRLLWLQKKSIHIQENIPPAPFIRDLSKHFPVKAEDTAVLQWH